MPDLPVLSRRSFLIGTAAAIAVASLPPLVQVVTSISKSRGPFRRDYNDITFGMPEGRPHIEDRPLTLTLERGTANGRSTIFHIDINPRAFYRWWAHPDNVIILPPEHHMLLTVEGGHYPAVIGLTFNEHIDRETYMPWFERHTFAELGAPTVDLQPLDTRPWSLTDPVVEYDSYEGDQVLLPTSRPSRSWLAPIRRLLT